MKGFSADDRGLQTVQFPLKLPGLIGLVKSRVEQRVGDIAQRKDANDKEEAPAPPNPWIILR